MTANIENVTVFEGHIPDEELQWFFNLSDTVVLPYKTVLTSGSVLNALSFSRPVIAPEMGMLPEVITNGENGWLYDPEDSRALFSAMSAFIEEFEAENREAIQQTALKSVENLTWSSFGQTLSNSIESISRKHELDIEVNGDTHTVLASRLPGPVAEQAKVAIIILNYKHSEDVKRLLKSVEEGSSKDVEIFIVDNNSPNLTEVQVFSLSVEVDLPVTVIRTRENLGYATGNNIGIEFANHQNFEYIWILNPDIELTQTSLENLIDAAESHREVSVFGSTILYGHNKKIWYAGANVSFENGLNTGHSFNGHDKEILPQQPFETEYVTGASIFMRPEILEKSGLIPEEYFLYYEETDWCVSLRQKGERLLVVPDSIMYHHKRSENDGLPADYYFYYFIRNSLNFVHKLSPNSLRATEIKIKNGFIRAWLDKISKRSPKLLSKYENIANQALKDGLSNLTGKVNLEELFKDNTLDSDNTDHAIIAHIDEGQHGKLVGWAINHLDQSQAVTLSVELGGEQVATVTADRERADLENLGLGKHAFEVDISRKLRAGELHEVSLSTLDGRKLHQTKHSIAPAENYKGRIDGVAGYCLRGWAYNVSNHSERPMIEIVHKGKVVSMGRCDQLRQDLIKSDIGDGYHGFEIRLPIEFLTGDQNHFEIRLAGNGQKLATRDCYCGKPIHSLPKFHLGNKFDWLFKNREFRYEDSENCVEMLDFHNQSSQVRATTFGKLAQDTLVTVITPTFNRIDTIRMAIDSVRDQSYANFEMLIIDDGSTDGTPDFVQTLINEYKDERIKLIPLAQNVGVSAARNVGLEAAQGEAIAYLDSDNDWDPSYLMVMINSLMESENTSSAYCGQTIWQVLQRPEKDYEEPVAIRTGHFWLGLLENRNYIDLNCFVHRTSLFKKFGGFNENMRRLVDWELIWRYAYYQAPKYVPVLLSRYFMDKAGNQITKLETYGDNLESMRESIRSSALDISKKICSEAILSTPIKVIVPFENTQDINNLDSLAMILKSHNASLCVVAPKSEALDAMKEEYASLDFQVSIFEYEENDEALDDEFDNFSDALKKALAKGGSLDTVVLRPEYALEKYSLYYLMHALNQCGEAGAIVSRMIAKTTSNSVSPYASNVFPMDKFLYSGAAKPSMGKFAHDHIFEIDGYPDGCVLYPSSILERASIEAINFETFKEFNQKIMSLTRWDMELPVICSGRSRAFLKR
jgi:GT2 family glycosyltransferase